MKDIVTPELANIRSTNLRILRQVGLSSKQDELAKIMSISQSGVSSREIGKETIWSAEARNLEKGFDLPEMWMDRNNANLFLDANEFAAIQKLRELPEVMSKAVFALIDAAQSNEKHNG